MSVEASKKMRGTSDTKTNQLMVFRKESAPYSENQKVTMTKLRGKNAVIER